MCCKRWLVFRVAALFILRSVGIFVCRFSVFLLSVVSSFRLAPNGLALGEEADFEALNCLPALNLIRSTKLQLTTEPAFLPNACYALCLFL
jgi:hypothetical protein